MAYKDVYSKIESQQQRIKSGVSQLQQAKKPSKAKDYIAYKRAMIRDKKFRTQEKKRKAKIEKEIKKLKEAGKELSEHKEKIAEYEKKGYKIKETDEGGYSFSRKVGTGGTTKTTRTVTRKIAPDYSKKLKQIESLEKSINATNNIRNSINKSIKNFEMARRGARGKAKEHIESQLSMLKHQKSVLNKQINAMTKAKNSIKLTIPSEAKKVVKAYETVTEQLESPVFQQLENLPEGHFLQKSPLVEIKKRLEQTQESLGKQISSRNLYLVSEGITPEYYKEAGTIIFPEQEIEGFKDITIPGETFKTEEQTYQDIVKWYQQRPEQVRLALKQKYEETEKIPEGYRELVEFETSTLGPEDRKLYEKFTEPEKEQLKSAYEESMFKTQILQQQPGGWEYPETSSVSRSYTSITPKAKGDFPFEKTWKEIAPKHYPKIEVSVPKGAAYSTEKGVYYPMPTSSPVIAIPEKKTESKNIFELTGEGVETGIKNITTGFDKAMEKASKSSFISPVGKITAEITGETVKKVGEIQGEGIKQLGKKTGDWLEFQKGTVDKISDYFSESRKSMLAHQFKYDPFFPKDEDKLRNEIAIGTTDTGVDIYLARGTPETVLDKGWSPIPELERKPILESAKQTIEGTKDEKGLYDYKKEVDRNIKDIDYQIKKAEKSPRNEYIVNDRRLTKQQLLEYLKNQRSNLKDISNTYQTQINEIKKIIERTSKGKGKKLKSEGNVVIYTKEPSPEEEAIKTLKKQSKDNWLAGLATWVSSGYTATGIMEDPFNIKSTGQVATGLFKGTLKEGPIMGLTGKEAHKGIEEAWRTKAKIYASTYDPTYKEYEYRRVHPMQAAPGKFFSGASGIVASPIIIPQMVIKYAKGKGSLTDVMGRIETGETIGPDVGESLYKTSPGGAKGAITTVASELITGGESPMLEKAQEDPRGFAFETGGEIAGLYALSYGASALGEKFPKASSVYMKYRPSAMATKGLKSSIVKGFRYPSLKGISQRSLTGLSKVASKVKTSKWMGKPFTRTFGKETVIKTRWASTFGEKATEYPILTRARGFISKHPSLSKAFTKAQELPRRATKLGELEMFPRSPFGIKPLIRKTPSIYGKLQEMTGGAFTTFGKKAMQIKSKQLTENLVKLTKKLDKVKSVKSSLGANPTNNQIVSAIKKIFKDKKLASEVSNQLKQGKITKEGAMKIIDNAAKYLDDEIKAIRFVQKKGGLPKYDQPWYKYSMTTPQKVMKWAKGEYNIPQLREAMFGSEILPEETIVYQGEGQYPIMSDLGVGYEKLYEYGGLHATVSPSTHVYKVVGTIDDLLKQTFKRTKTSPKISDALKTGNSVDDVLLENLRANPNLVYGGSKAMKMMAKWNIAKAKKFFGKTVDDDLIVMGGYRETERITRKIASELTKKTGRKYTVDTAFHEGTWTIRNPAGKRIIDITASESPSASFLGPSPTTRIPLEGYIRNVNGVKVADPRWLVLNELEVQALRGTKPQLIGKINTLVRKFKSKKITLNEFKKQFNTIIKKDIEKRQLHTKIYTGKSYPEIIFGQGGGGYFGSTPIAKRGLFEKFTETGKSMFGREAKESIVGYSSRLTKYNPWQYRLKHYYPAKEGIGTWVIKSAKEPTKYQFSILKPGWKAKPRIHYEPSPGSLLSKSEMKLIRGAYDKGAEEGAVMTHWILSERQILGKPPARIPTGKASEMIRKGQIPIEAESAHGLGIGLKRGITPATKLQLQKSGFKPFQETIPITKFETFAKRWKDVWGGFRGYKHYTMIGGRKVPIFPEEAVWMDELKRGRLLFDETTGQPLQMSDIKTRGAFIKDIGAQQPVFPKFHPPKGISYAERTGTETFSQLAKEQKYAEMYWNVRESPVAYRASVAQTKYYPEKYKAKEYEPYVYKTPEYKVPEYKIPYRKIPIFEPAYTSPEPYKYDEYDYKTDYGYRTEEYEEPRYEPPTYTPYGYEGFHQIKPKPLVIIGPKQKEKKKEKRVKRKVKIKYKEREFDIPFVWTGPNPFEGFELKKITEPKKKKNDVNYIKYKEI